MMKGQIHYKIEDSFFLSIFGRKQGCLRLSMVESGDFLPSPDFPLACTLLIQGFYLLT